MYCTCTLILSLPFLLSPSVSVSLSFFLSFPLSFSLSLSLYFLLSLSQCHSNESLVSLRKRVSERLKVTPEQVQVGTSEKWVKNHIILSLLLL